MSVTEIDFVHNAGTPPVPTNATSVTFCDPTDTFGLQRKDNNAIVIPANTPLTRTGTGIYHYEFTDPASDLFYRYYLKVVWGSLTTFIERETSIEQAIPLEITGRYATYAGMKAKYGTSNLQRWASVDGSENQQAQIDAITAAMDAADNYIDSLLLGGPYIVPFTSVPYVIKEVANVLAGVLLYDSQAISDTQSSSDLGAEAVGRFKTQRQMAMRTLGRIKVGDIMLMDADNAPLAHAERTPSAGIAPRLAYVNGEPVLIEDAYEYIPENIFKFY